MLPVKGKFHKIDKRVKYFRQGKKTKTKLKMK